MLTSTRCLGPTPAKGSTGPEERLGQPDDRLRALAEVAASRASSDFNFSGFHVMGFREGVLGGRLIAPEAIPQWVADHRSAEGPPAAGYILFPLPPTGSPKDHSYRQDDWLRRLAFRQVRDRDGLVRWLRAEADALAAIDDPELPGGSTQGPETLSFFAPGSPVQTVTIRRDGELAALKGVVGGPIGLTKRFAWAEHHAVAFVLSGWVPPFFKWRSRYRFGDMPALDRVSLEIDPRMSSGQVVALYNEARGSERATRDAAPAPKSLALAQFTQTWAGSDRWPALQTKWNEDQTHPAEWHYKDRHDQGRRFALDCRRAWTRLTQQPWAQFAPVTSAPPDDQGDDHGQD